MTGDRVDNLKAAPSAAATLAKWAEPMPGFGRSVYRITRGQQEHKHAYYYLCPWSPDGRSLLLMRYVRENPEADICVVDTSTGKIATVGKTARWNSHSAAFQQWTVDGRIVYVTGSADRVNVVVVQSDGSGERSYLASGLDDQVCVSPDGRWVYSASPMAEMFPGDAIAQRDDKGLIRMNLKTGESELILSIDQALAVVPARDAIASFHLYFKRIIPHPHLPRLLVNLTNALWDVGGKERSVRTIISVNLDGSAAAFVGTIVHHPCWHPLEDCVVANVRDDAGKLRFGLLRSATPESPEHIPAAPGSGHPSFSPDGRWLCTDGAGPDGKMVVFCDPRTGEFTVAAEVSGVGADYATFKALSERKQGDTVIDALARAGTATGKTWQTHGHPVWSPDGSAVLFNADTGQGSQLYFVDVEGTLKN